MADPLQAAPAPSGSLSVPGSSWPPAPYGADNVPSEIHGPRGAGSSGLRPKMSDYLASFRDELRLGPRRRRPALPSSDADDEEADSEGYDADAEATKMRKEQARPPSLTMSVWRGGEGTDWRVRLAALGATLAINLLLPFVNGVMLGLGEITARELVGFYLGWGPAAAGRKRRWDPQRRPSASAAATASSSPSPRERGGVRTASGVGLSG